MAENSRKWVGSTRAIQTQYGELFSVSFNQEHLDFLKENMNEKGWVKITVSKNAKGQGSSWLDEWQPTNGGGSSSQGAPVNGGGNDDLPF